MNHPSTPKASDTPGSEATAPAARQLRVLCVDDESAVTRALGKLINMQSDLECVGELPTAEGLVDEVIHRRADVVLLDLTMPGPDPIQAIRDLTVRVPSCRVLAFSGYDDEATRAEVRAAGACGLVGKGSQPLKTIEAIRQAGGVARPKKT